MWGQCRHHRQHDAQCACMTSSSKELFLQMCCLQATTLLSFRRVVCSHKHTAALRCLWYVLLALRHHPPFP
jgi:hypothetical protein